jgi:restriction endonuclease Mrr
VKNSGGIRARKAPDGGLAVLVLLSSHVSVATYNPWDDIIDDLQGRIWYWGDAKAHPVKTRDAWFGNQCLQRVWIAVGEKRWEDVPPILHFSKLAKGHVKFMGLCVLTDLQDGWIEDKGHRVRNLRARLDILDVEDVPVSWIQGRIHGLQIDVPKEWRKYEQTGVHNRLVVYKKHVRSREEQIPTNAEDLALLHTLNQIEPFQFERAIVRTFEAMDIGHDIQGTRAVRDGGFDFFGQFRLPPPLAYSIPMKGEVKRYDPAGGGVGPKDVARLVARLQRGEHGIFATSSYFTTQAQNEIFEDRYPVELIYGNRLIALLKTVGAIRGGELDPVWLATPQP